MANKYSQLLMFSGDQQALYAAHPFGLVDAGARSDVPEPWNELPPAHLQVVGFEPDPQEAARLMKGAPPGRTYVDKALWSQRGNINVHLAVKRSTSSVYPPNLEVLKYFQEARWKRRQTERVVAIAAETVDACLAEQNRSFDFLKVDVHGAEFEILAGARHALESDLMGVLVESWNVEAHLGQKLTGHIMNALAELHFAPFDVYPTITWRRKEWADLHARSKCQMVGQSTLFFKEPTYWSERQLETGKIVRAAAIAEVYGFPDFALHILDVGLERLSAGKQGAGNIEPIRAARQHIVRHWTTGAQAATLRYRVGKKLESWVRRLFRLDAGFAPLS